MKRVLLVLLTVWIAASCGGCIQAGKESLPEDTIEEFETAMNAMDVDGMLDCMDSGAVKSLTAGLDIAMGIAGAVTGIDIGIGAEDLLAVMPLFQGFAVEYSDGIEYPQVDFQVYETRIKANRATVYFTEVYSGEPMILNMKKKDGQWKITLNTQEISEEAADRVLIAGQEEETVEASIWDLFDQEKLEEVVRQVLGARAN